MVLAVMFELVTPYQPAGDQPQAIAKLTDGILSGAKHQTLPGVTSSERHSRWRTRA
jgi:excinuclease ABC subunit B